MKIAICEDEQWFALSLKEKIESFCVEKNTDAHVALYSDGGSFLAACESGELFDAVFMDINLGKGADGMDTTAKLRELGDSVPVIFVTSLENRAVDGYDVSAFGFVVKKNCDEKLPVVLEKLWKKLYVKKTVTVTTKDGAVIMNTDDILYAESDGRCTAMTITASKYTPHIMTDKEYLYVASCGRSGTLDSFEDTQRDFNIFAYDINEKHTENIVTIEDGWLYSGTAVGEKFWYTLQGEDFIHRIMIYDPQTKKSTEFMFDEDIQPKGITTDGKYLYIADEKINHISKENVIVAVCTLDGEKIAEFEIPISDSAQGVGEEYALNIVDDTVYIQYYEKVVCCTLEDILDGNTVWEEVFRFEGRVV